MVDVTDRMETPRTEVGIQIGRLEAIADELKKQGKPLAAAAVVETAWTLSELTAAQAQLAEEREANRIAAEHVGVRIFIDPLNRHIAVNERAEQAERERDELREVLRYWREECSGAEPSLSVFERKVDQALSNAVIDAALSAKSEGGGR